MGRLSDAILGTNNGVVSKKVELDLGEGSRDEQGKPTVLHDSHIVAAYCRIGSPWFCGYVGDSMGNQIRLHRDRLRNGSEIAADAFRRANGSNLR